MVNEQTCCFCNRSFAQDEAQPTCSSCPLKGGCQMVRCPHCGYENPVAPAWLGRLKAWFGTAAARNAGYDESGTWTGEADETEPLREVACR
jgi:hypothetical protein